MRELETEVRRDVERIFGEKKRRLGVDAKLDLHVETVEAPPIVGENVYGEAFPAERPPRVWMEVFPEATTREITKIVCEELLHIKHPGLSEDEIAKMVPKCIEGDLWDKKRCAFCATELASVIGRMGEWELHLEKDDWEKIDDELPILEDEINMVGGACDLDVQEALKDYEELKESVRNRDKRGVLAAMGKIEANTFYKLAKIAVKPRSGIVEHV